MIISVRLWLVAVNTFLLMASVVSLHAQIPAPATFYLSPDQLEPYLLPAQDNQALLEQEMEQRQSGLPPRFATPIPVRIQPTTAGRWDIIGQTAVWRLRLYSPGAHSLNLGFTQYQMPEGGKLYLYDPEKGQKKGPFTPADNEAHNQLWTPVFPGDELIIEIQVPVSNKSKLEIELSVINHDFLGLGQVNSGSCNLDIICGLEDGWDIVEPFRDVARSVGLYSMQGTLLCTGFLVNNTQEDCTPYFLTANHCQVTTSTAPSVVVYWNFQNSTCRQPESFESGQSGDGQLDDFNTGAIFRSSWSNSDFCLIELDDPVSETANAYFAGWSALDELPQEPVVSIHHPVTDEKRISFSDNNSRFGFWGSSNEAENGNHIIVNSWEIGTTEEGSSGGPLFNSRGQVIGQLHGGEAACGNSSYDTYGRIYNSWEGGGTKESRLKDWLDPINLGVLSMNGREQDRCDLSITGTFTSGNICAGDQDTLHLYIGEGFESVPDIALENISPELGITFESIAADTGAVASYVWFTGPATPPGAQTVEVYTTYNGQTDTSYVVLSIHSTEAPRLLAPADITEIQGLEVAFKWEPILNGEQYHLQLAFDPDFNNIFSDQVVEAVLPVKVTDLIPNATFYWRVAVENTCGLSPWSDTYSFTTADVNCVLAGSDTPVMIPDNPASTISSELNLALSGTIISIEVNDLNIQHNWIGDLSVKLRSPSGTEVALLDRPGFPSSLYGCEGTDLLISFNEATGNDHQTLESACNFSSPAISGTYKSLEPLQVLIGEQAGGTWTLIVEDNADDDGGSLVGWELSICTVPEELPLIAGLSDAYSVCLDDSVRLELIVSEDFSEEAVNLAVDPIPVGTTVSFSKNPAAPGDTVAIVLNEFSISGNYLLELSASDGSTSGLFPFDLEVIDLPSPVTLLAPAADASLSLPATTFSWTSAGNAIYRLEIAADPEFSTILLTAETEETTYTLDLPEQEEAFYWRITTINDCGEDISAVSSFSFKPSALSDFRDGRQAKVYPNPFSNRLFLTFTQVLEVPVQLRLMDVSGRVQFSDEIRTGNLRYEISLDQLSAGIYFLELNYRGQRHLQRLVKGL